MCTSVFSSFCDPMNCSSALLSMDSPGTNTGGNHFLLRDFPNSEIELASPGKPLVPYSQVLINSSLSFCFCRELLCSVPIASFHSLFCYPTKFNKFLLLGLQIDGHLAPKYFSSSFKFELDVLTSGASVNFSHFTTPTSVSWVLFVCIFHHTT